TKLSIDGGTPIDCTKVTDSGTTTTSTATEVTIVPTFLECGTEGAGHNMTVDMNGCHYLVRIGKSAGGHNTIQFVCPTGLSARLTHPNCTIAIPAQTPSGGLSYTTTTENGKHALTVDVTVSGITAHYEGGICVFLGTSHSATINGSVTIAGINTAGSPVNITATGSSGS
ncbi:MAG TPA: hypothetical protein VEQ41_06460, partial [Solirubrobacterales bacterium]|nr:hypothetical protein [Solirubrobacterales bacterium]